MDGSISVKYTMKGTFKPGSGLTAQYLNIGYEFPPKYRVSNLNKNFKINYKKGTHTLVIPKPGNIIGDVNIVAKFGAYRYSETKQLKTVKNYPTGYKVKYVTVGSVAPVASYLAYYTIPGAVLTYAPQTKIIKVAGGAFFAWSNYMGITGSLNLSKGFPMPVKGQYHEITTYYNEKGLNIRTKIWTNKESYNKKVKPIYDGTYTDWW